MKKIIFITIITVITFTAFIAESGEAKAQGLSLGIWPPLLEVMIQPGKSITQVYKIINNGETDLVLTSKIVPFEPADELGNIILSSEVSPAAGDRNSSPANLTELFPSEVGWPGWFSFQNADLALGEKFLLPAGKEQQIVLKIKIPPQATEKDYYLTLLFETAQIPGMYLGQNQSGGQVEAKIGGNILLTVSQTGQPKKQAEVKDFRISNTRYATRNTYILDSFVRPQFLVRLKNNGRAFFKPNGTITTTGWFGQKWALDLLPENVLAGSIRQITCQKSAPATAPGEETTQTLPSSCQLPAKFLLGKYTARLEFGLDENSGEYQSELVFWAVPLKLLLGIGVCLTLLVIIFQKFSLKK